MPLRFGGKAAISSRGRMPVPHSTVIGPLHNISWPSHKHLEESSTLLSKYHLQPEARTRLIKERDPGVKFKEAPTLAPRTGASLNFALLTPCLISFSPVLQLGSHLERSM